MESLQWFCLGLLSMLAIQGMVYVSMVVKLKWYAIPLLITGVISILFGFAWAGSSYIEGYPQSSSMALVFFSGFGLVLTVVTWQRLVKPGIKSE